MGTLEKKGLGSKDLKLCDLKTSFPLRTPSHNAKCLSSMGGGLVGFKVSMLGQQGQVRAGPMVPVGWRMGWALAERQQPTMPWACSKREGAWPFPLPADQRAPHSSHPTHPAPRPSQVGTSRGEVIRKTPAHSCVLLRRLPKAPQENRGLGAQGKGVKGGVCCTGQQPAERKV